jgi:uncharacterized membrane protein YkvA (DUF1232 family)
MTHSLWWDLLIGMASALLIAWIALVVVLVIARPRGGLLREALRLLPDVLRLIRRLVADTTLPRGVRIRLGLVLAYLALPIDLIPDFIPVLGYADDAITVIVVLRAVARRAGVQAVGAHWPGIRRRLCCADPTYWTGPLMSKRCWYSLFRFTEGDGRCLSSTRRSSRTSTGCSKSVTETSCTGRSAVTHTASPLSSCTVAQDPGARRECANISTPTRIGSWRSTSADTAGACRTRAIRTSI